MDRDEVLRLAREAGLIHYYDSESQWSGVTNENLIEQDKNRNDDRLVEILSPFAALVAAREREACALQALEGTGEPVQTKTLEVLRTERQRIANAIRARSKE